MSPITYTVASTRLEAARELPSLPTGHPARALHGHSFQMRVVADLPADWVPYPGAAVQVLQRDLDACLAPLNYQCLNHHLDDPTDEQLVVWVQDRLKAPGRVRVSVQSTTEQGVDLDAAGELLAWRRYTLHAAHHLPQVPPGHPCGRLHGHRFQVLVQAGPGVSYADIDAAWAPVHAQLDHAVLNEVAGLSNPTSELLSAWLWQELAATLPAVRGVTVFETASCGAHFDGQQHQIWKEFSVDSALRLQHAPADSPEARVHGQTFALRLHLSAPLDTVMGWTQDFGDVKTLFEPTLRALDHHALHELADGPADGDCASIAAWVLQRARAELPDLVRADLYQDEGCGAIVACAPGGALLPL